ncbi:triosephosphate isomerase [Mitosporidium daphniae]|uniref:Triosephosphate isomerase n=1 Tax=Mitosporidium daphniae TaxID=1485682 RepID=A0A098VN00_9MICR|nr:triosephosphate isomerase [Mitosporidium daphniae]KGG50403.1 triosephosphate isomerase [Mitosporidium daphniae]|eukprot:XP_013236839.1 triosephosphate isomerase [Mitosporidium daphniae]
MELAHSRKPFVGGNWKMNGTLLKIKQVAAEPCKRCPRLLTFVVDIVIAPPTPFLAPAMNTFPGAIMAVSAQNLNEKASGAFTGEHSAEMLRELGVTWTIVGHSERRSLFCESDELVCAKTASAVNSGLSVIFCFGEPLETREAGMTWEYVSAQLKALFVSIEKAWDAAARTKILERLLLAYEPIWAIGTGRVATPSQAQEIHALIRKSLAENLGVEVASQIRIIYGGSVNAKNCEVLSTQPDIDGFLVGGASLTSDFATIVQASMSTSS